MMIKNKILNTFSIKSNNETITVDTIQTDKGIQVEINGLTMDVIINDEIVYSKFDNEDYKYIPVNMRSFVEENLCSWSDGIVVKENSVECDIEINGNEYYVQIPKNKAKEEYIYISNWLESYEKIQEYDIEIPNAKENFDKLISDIESVGYDFVFKWDGNEYDDTYGLKFKSKDFSEDKILQCIKLWEDYNKILEKYIDMINQY